MYKILFLKLTTGLKYRVTLYVYETNRGFCLFVIDLRRMCCSMPHHLYIRVDFKLSQIWIKVSLCLNLFELMYSIIEEWTIKSSMS